MRKEDIDFHIEKSIQELIQGVIDGDEFKKKLAPTIEAILKERTAYPKLYASINQNFNRFMRELFDVQKPRMREYIKAEIEDRLMEKLTESFIRRMESMFEASWESDQ